MDNKHLTFPHHLPVQIYLLKVVIFSSLNKSLGRAVVVTLASVSASASAFKLDILVKVFFKVMGRCCQVSYPACGQVLLLLKCISVFCSLSSGPGCSKLTTSLVNISLKFQTLMS